VTTLCWLGWTLWYLGYSDEAVKVGEAGCQLAEEVGHTLSQAYACNISSRVHQFRRDARRRRPRLKPASPLHHAWLPDWLAQSNVVLGWR